MALPLHARELPTPKHVFRKIISVTLTLLVSLRIIIFWSYIFLRPYCAPQNAYVADVLVCGTVFPLTLHLAPDGAENTLCNTHK